MKLGQNYTKNFVLNYISYYVMERYLNSSE